MILDLDTASLAPTLETQVCIIGGGAAGLTLALEFDRQGIDAVVLESGGEQAEAGSRDLARGISSGLPYQFADGCRSRFLGGSSNCWGGWCRPLDDHDFAVRPAVPLSGWPIGPQDLHPFHERVHRVLRLGPGHYDVPSWAGALGRADVRRFPFAGQGLINDAVSQFSPPVRMGLDYRRELAGSRHLKVCLHANLTALQISADGTHLEQATARSLQGAQVRVRARMFVLATGGIENARLLLALGPEGGPGLGNRSGWVGRCFMDHPRVASARVFFAEGWRRNKLYDHKFHYQNPGIAVQGTRFGAQLMLAPEVQHREGLLNANLWFESLLPGDGTPAAEVLIRMKHRLDRKEKQGYSLVGDLARIAMRPLDATGFVLGRLLQPEWLIRGVRMTAIVEPEPDPDSRVTLSTERDALGLPRVQVNWRLGRNVKRTFDRNFALMAQALETSGLARVALDPPIEGADWPATFADEGTWHHMGTTRMHPRPEHGVVDADCRVHELQNLYVAGSSVFPTAGANFPTFTLVALALRLADRLADELRRPVASVQAAAA